MYLQNDNTHSYVVCSDRYAALHTQFPGVSHYLLNLSAI